MSVAEFLKGLPSYNETNFSRFHSDANSRSGMKRPSVYIPTKDYPSEQVIVTEKTSILLRYLHELWNKKQTTQKKRDYSCTLDGVNEDSEAEPGQRKRVRFQGQMMPTTEIVLSPISFPSTSRRHSQQN